ncbi:MAG: hypothetical protein Q7S40_07855 [Opitutaceae bacterium]|nr:hypothetical protein [Opitutaceae bacterium]
MNNQEAKLVLSSYRSNGRDAIDPRFTDPLAQASTDPTLRSWFEREQAFDRDLVSRVRRAPRRFPRRRQRCGRGRFFARPIRRHCVE